MKKKRILGSISAFLLLTVLITACGSNQSSNQRSSTANGGNENVNLKVAMWNIQDAFNTEGASEDTVFNDLQQKYNVTINPVQITWNDWQEKIKVWAASSQLPDVFPNDLAANLDLYKTWAKQGIIKPLPDDLSKYPNIQKVMSEPSIKSFEIDGKFYMIPRMTYSNSSDWSMDRPIYYRKDWAAEAGFTSQPQSFEELVTMIKAVQKLHPGTTGITINNKPYLLTTFLGSFPEEANDKSWVKEDGEWLPSFASTKMYEGVKQLRTLYQEGLLDKDIAFQKDNDGVVKFVNGQSFILFGGMTYQFIDQFVQANPDVKFEDAFGFMDWYPAADGQHYTFSETPFWSEIYFNNKMDDSSFDRALQMIDYMMSDEYATLAKNGIEGTDYQVKDGKAVSLLKDGESLTEKYPITFLFYPLGAWHNGFIYTGKQVVSSNPNYALYDQMFIDKFNELKKTAKPAPVNFEISMLSTPAKDKAANLRTDAMNSLFKVIIGKDDPVEMWKKEIKALDAKGLQEAIDETNKAAEEKGIQ